jgi:ParB-like chromosome segregation protein Spo0J
VKVVYIPISKLKPMPGNPRIITADELRKLKRSLKQYGFTDPVIVYAGPDKKHVGEIIGGHQRVRAAKELGIKKVPCVLWKGDYRKARALNVDLNRIGGDFDYEKLVSFAEGLEDYLIGFSPEELKELVQAPIPYGKHLAPVRDMLTEEFFDEEGNLKGSGKVKRCVCCGQPIKSE